MRRPTSVEQDIRYRDGIVRTTLNKGRAIRAFCAECMGWEAHPKECTVTICPLYAFRGQFRPGIARPDLRGKAIFTEKNAANSANGCTATTGEPSTTGAGVAR